MDPQPTLQTDNAAAAILVLEDGCYLLQLRDDMPQIWYPDYWGFFGGSVEPGEGPLEALKRELYEELELEITQARLFTHFEFDLRPLGLDVYARSYYEIPIRTAELARLNLHEGAEMRRVSGHEALTMKLVPYDGFALFLHHHQKRLVARQPPP